MTARDKTRALVALIAALQVADIMTTNAALRVPGVIEVNPLMSWSQHSLGAVWWLPKVALMGVAAALFLKWQKPRPALIAAVLWLLIVGNNVLSIFYG